MERASTSTERTPLVQPAYVFESSLAKRYERRLKQFQCCICVTFVIGLGVALLMTISYSLTNDVLDGDDTNTTDYDTATNSAGNLTQASPYLGPLLKLSWPLQGRPSPEWVAEQPTAETMASAISRGSRALEDRRLMEATRTPLPADTPAGRAQMAVATDASVKPMADAAYAVEEATRVLVAGINTSYAGSVGAGPRTNGTWPEPRYCLDTAPPCPVTKYRSFDGTCNNLANPLRWGVADTPFRRALPPVYGDGISSPRTGVNGTLPSARDVSVTVHRPSYARDTSFTVMLAVWGQFIDHDITATALNKGAGGAALRCCAPAPAHGECFPVALARADPFYRDYGLSCMEFVRSAPAHSCRFGPRQQLNQATAFLDGSAVYGRGAARAGRLRAGAGGRLRMRDGDLLPPAADPRPRDGCNTEQMAREGKYCFETGDDRANENLHLTTMHLIWARQHNLVAAELARLNPLWDDDRLYHESRRIVAAQIQHITYSEFLPIILGDDMMGALNLSLRRSGYSRDYDPGVDPSIANHFAAAAFRFAHTLLPGLMSAGEEGEEGEGEEAGAVPLHEMLFNPFALYGAGGCARAVRSALATPARAVRPHVTPELTNHLFERPTGNSSVKRGPCGLDLVSLNIQRGRDHGLPPYPAWREFCGFSRPKSFEDLEHVFDGPSLARISTIYASVEDVDLYTGALAEDPRGRLLGPTLTCLLADQFLRIKRGDRFWYETDDVNVRFTPGQLAALRETSLARVLCATVRGLRAAPALAMRARRAGAGAAPPCARRAAPAGLRAWAEH